MYDAILLGGIPGDTAGRTIGLYRIRTALESAGYSAYVVDYAWALNAEQMLLLLQALVTDRTVLLGISTSWYNGDNAPWMTEQFFAAVKSAYPNIIVVAGGGSSAIRHPVLSKYCKYYITGYADDALVALLNHARGVRGSLRYFKHSSGAYLIEGDKHYLVSPVDRIETVLKADDDFLPHQPVPIEISRGCIFKCSFCTFPLVGRKDVASYVRSPESIARELRRNYELFGTVRYTIVDDTFNDSTEKLDRVERAVELARLPKFEFVCYVRPELLVTKAGMIEQLARMGYKGGHFGIESTGAAARKAIGKGMEIGRVLEAVHKLTEAGTYNHASLITGLPGDTERMQYDTAQHLINHREQLFRSWVFYGLGLSNNADGSASSEFSRNPEKHGYVITEDPARAPWLNWTSDTGMTVDRANELAEVLNKMSYRYKKTAAWNLAYAWHSNIPQEQIDQMSMEQITKAIRQTGAVSNRVRTEFQKVVDIVK